MLTAWLLVGCGMIVLLAAANRKPQQHICKSITVSIRGDGEQFFIDKGDILKSLTTSAKGTLLNKPVANINLTQLEKSLEMGLWIRDAELYFDSRDVLHVLVWEREPIARVFTTVGSSFYIDSAGKRMPLLKKVSVRVPVITGFSAAKKLNVKDSLLLGDLTRLVQYMTANTFWNAQIAQIDVLPTGTLELLPVIGNHTVRFGTTENFEEKLKHLFLFYKQVSSKAGFDKYAVLDVQFKNQVVAMQKNTVSAVDSIQLQKNIKALLNKSKQQAFYDSVALIRKKDILEQQDSLVKKFVETVKVATTIDTNRVSVRPLPNSVKQNIPSKPMYKPKGAKKKVEEKPKAVMKKRNDY